MEGKLNLKLNVVDENGCELTDGRSLLYQTTYTVRYVEKRWSKSNFQKFEI